MRTGKIIQVAGSVVDVLRFAADAAGVITRTGFEVSGLKKTRRGFAVTAPEEARVQRLMQRDSISPEYARSRIAAQPSARWFAQRCDAVLENNGTAEEFRKKSIAFLDSHGIIKTVCSG